MLVDSCLIPMVALSVGVMLAPKSYFAKVYPFKSATMFAPNKRCFGQYNQVNYKSAIYSLVSKSNLAFFFSQLCSTPTFSTGFLADGMANA